MYDPYRSISKPLMLKNTHVNLAILDSINLSNPFKSLTQETPVPKIFSLIPQQQDTCTYPELDSMHATCYKTTLHNRCRLMNNLSQVIYIIIFIIIYKQYKLLQQ